MADMDLAAKHPESTRAEVWYVIKGRGDLHVSSTDRAQMEAKFDELGDRHRPRILARAGLGEFTILRRVR